MSLFTLFKIFFKIGLFTFGGGYSMLPFIEREVTQKHKFITSDELLDIFSISECTPGPVSVNCATFIGYKIGGVLGSLVSTLGLITPSFLIILLISMFLDYFKSIVIINKFLSGIKVGVILLLINSVLKIASKSDKSKSYYLIVLITLLISLFTNISTIIILCLSIIISVILITIRRVNKR